ncbi:hypothetical protein HK098_005118 [Nowakowskiella sp. JEL0407]|nr:hypothetical protein HK098_005118 [Nowakowskiella sp. JEL0407]
MKFTASILLLFATLQVISSRSSSGKNSKHYGGDPPATAYIVDPYTGNCITIDKRTEYMDFNIAYLDLCRKPKKHDALQMFDFVKTKKKGYWSIRTGNRNKINYYGKIKNGEYDTPSGYVGEYCLYIESDGDVAFGDNPIGEGFCGARSQTNAKKFKELKIAHWRFAEPKEPPQNEYTKHKDTRAIVSRYQVDDEELPEFKGKLFYMGMKNPGRKEDVRVFKDEKYPWILKPVY